MKGTIAGIRGWVQLLIICAIVAVGCALAIPTIDRARDSANLALCADHLRAIGVILGNYEKKYDGNLPPSATVDGAHVDLLNCFAAGQVGVDPNLFYCPAEHRENLRFSTQHFKDGIIGYYWYCANAVSSNPALSKFLKSGVTWPRKLDTTMDHRSWVMSDIWVSGVPTAHAGYRKGLNYLMLDGSVAFISESPRQSFH